MTGSPGRTPRCSNTSLCRVTRPLAEIVSFVIATLLARPKVESNIALNVSSGISAARRVTPATTVGVTSRLLEIGDIVRVVEEQEANE